MSVRLRLLVIFSAALSQLANAQVLTVPNAFANGQPADADEVNANFDAIENTVNGNAVAISSILEGGAARELFGFSPVDVDCTSDPTAFDRAFLDSAPLDPVNLKVQGTCTIENNVLDVVGREVRVSAQEGSTATLSAERINLTSGMFWLDGVFVESPTDLIRFGSFANGYLRLNAARDPDNGFSIIEADLLLDPVTFDMFHGSDLRIFDISSPIGALRIRNGSTVELRSYSGAISDVVLTLNSTLWCRFCFNDFTGTVQAEVNSAFLADSTDPGWSVSGSFNVEHGSVVRIAGSAPVDPNDVTLTPDSVFTDDPPEP